MCSVSVLVSRRAGRPASVPCGLPEPRLPAPAVLFCAPRYRCDSSVMTLLTGFVGGLLHPLLAPAHVVALIGLGLIAGRNFLATGAAIIAAFAFGLAGGLGAIAWGVGETPATDVLLAGATLCGL